MQEFRWSQPELRCDSGLPRVVLHQDREASIPVCLKAEGVPGRCVVLEGVEAAVTLPTVLPKLVVRKRRCPPGYYRSLLEPKLFLSLASQAASQLTAAERLTLVQDVLGVDRKRPAAGERKLSACFMIWRTIPSRWLLWRLVAEVRGLPKAPYLGIIIGEKRRTCPTLDADGPRNARQADPDNSPGRRPYRASPSRVAHVPGKERLQCPRSARW